MVYKRYRASGPVLWARPQVIPIRTKISSESIKNSILDKVEELSGQKIYACYQCGKCSAGCPMTKGMDLLPNQIIRMIQLGLDDDVLSSKTIWTCASCFTCESRCPKGIDLTKVMEAVRIIVLRKGKDKIGPADLDKKTLEEGPQQLMVCTARKYSI